jgi:hypothetical protein
MLRLSGPRVTVNKAKSLALLVGVLAAALAFTPVSWHPGPERAQQLNRGAVSPRVVAASAHRPAEGAEPPEYSQTTTILLPSRSNREDVKVSSQPYKGGEPPRLVRDLQRELKRVGCYPHEIDGEWTPGTRKAMKEFTDRVNAALPVERPDPAHLTLLQSHPEIVCRESCWVGESFADNRCLPTWHVASKSKKVEATTVVPQIIWTKSYVTPASPEPDDAEATPPPVVTPRADTAPPRPRRPTSRPSGGGSLLFGIFSW